MSVLGDGVRPLRAFVAVLCLLVVACEESGQGEQSAAPPPPSVIVAPAAMEPLTASAEFIGRVEAVDRVDLRARVTGFLEKRLFEEGENVAEGDLLLVIEKPPFEAALKAAEASRAQAEASYAEAKATRVRNEEAARTGAVSRQQVDEAVAREEVAEASILSASAEIDIKALDLGYTDIKAPISGRIGQENVSVGNLVGPDTGTLATIVSQDPIYVSFPISRLAVLEYQKRVAESGNTEAGAVVRLRLADGTIYKHPGKIDFADISINRTTDTLLIRAVFPNPDGFLIDGQFSPVFVESGQPKMVLFVPQSALQADQAGRFVMVVDGDNKVQIRRVKIGAEREGKAEITDGLSEGDLVIVQGVQKVRPEQVVQTSPMPAPPSQGAKP